MSKDTLLGPGHILRMTLWLIFCRYKVQAMRYYEYNCGMVDLFAYKRAKNMSKKECMELLKEQNEKK